MLQAPRQRRLPQEQNYLKRQVFFDGNGRVHGMSKPTSGFSKAFILDIETARGVFKGYTVSIDFN